jgi:hypothetical protein
MNSAGLNRAQAGSSTGGTRARADGFRREP